MTSGLTSTLLNIWHMLTKYIISEEHCVCSKGAQGLPQDYYDVSPLLYLYTTLHRLKPVFHKHYYMTFPILHWQIHQGSHQ